MSLKKKLAAVLLMAAVVLLNIGILCHTEERIEQVSMHFSVLAAQEADVAIFYSDDDIFTAAFGTRTPIR